MLQWAIIGLVLIGGVTVGLNLMEEWPAIAVVVSGYAMYKFGQ